MKQFLGRIVFLAAAIVIDLAVSLVLMWILIQGWMGGGIENGEWRVEN